MDDSKTSTTLRITENLTKSASKYTRSIEQIEKQLFALNDSIDVFGKGLDIVSNRYKSLFLDSPSTSKGADSAKNNSNESATVEVGKALESIGKGLDVFKDTIKDINTAKSIANSFQKSGFKGAVDALGKAKFNFLPSDDSEKNESSDDSKKGPSGEKKPPEDSFNLPSIGEIVDTVQKGMNVYDAGKSVVQGYKDGGLKGGLKAVLKTDFNALFSDGENKANPDSDKNKKKDSKKKSKNKSGKVQKVHVVNINQLKSNGKDSKGKGRRGKSSGYNPAQKKVGYDPAKSTPKSNSLFKAFGKVSKFGPLKYLSNAVQGANLLTDNEMPDKEKAIEATKLAASTGGAALGAWGGAAAGAAIGSVVPVVGTAIGGIIGGLVGGFLGGEAGESIASNVTDVVTESSTEKKSEPQSANIKIQVEGEAKVKSIETENMNLDIAGSSMGGS